MTGTEREKEGKKTLKNCFNIKPSNIITSFLPLKRVSARNDRFMITKVKKGHGISM